MKKLFLLLAVSVIGCAKVETKPSKYVNATVRFRASYINEQYERDINNITIEVEGLETYTFVTHDNPCGNMAFQFRTLSQEDSCFVPYMVRTERDTLSVGMLLFSDKSELIFK